MQLLEIVDTVPGGTWSMRLLAGRILTHTVRGMSLAAGVGRLESSDGIFVLGWVPNFRKLRSIAFRTLFLGRSRAA